MTRRHNDKALTPSELAQEFGVEDLNDIADDLYTDYERYVLTCKDPPEAFPHDEVWPPR